MAKAVAAAAAFLSAPAAGGWATPFSPDPELGEPGSLRASLISTTFQTDPRQAKPVMRHPWLLRMETAVASRLSAEATLSDGIGLGVKAALAKEPDAPLDLALGFDELLRSSDRTLFGVADDTGTLAPSGRAWIGVGQVWEFVRARAAVSTEPTRASWNVVPWVGMETAFRLPFSLGWEGRWEDGTFRTSVGVSLAWKPFRLAGGLTEFQSWTMRGWSVGWHPDPPPGSLDGRDNPGWWVSVVLDIPGPGHSPDPVREQAPAPPAAVPPHSGPAASPAPAPAAPSAAGGGPWAGAVADSVSLRILRADLGELAVRARIDSGSDPVGLAILRRRMLSGHPGARRELWTLGLAPSTPLDERVQAVLTLSDGMDTADTANLELLSRDPAPRLRLESGIALSRIQSAAGRRVLETMALDPDDSVREPAKLLLKRMEAKDPKAPPEEGARKEP